MQPIAIVVAMPDEMRQLEELLRAYGARPDGSEVHGPRRFDRVTLDAMPLVLTTSGIGMVAAGAATEAIIGRYGPRGVLNYGCTGAHREDILPGDVVIGTACIAYAGGRVRPGGTFEYTKPWFYRNGEDRRVDAWPVSDALLALAESIAAAGGWRQEAWPEAHWRATEPHRPPRVFFGPVASADRFTQDPDALRALHAQHASLCEDMEAAAIAQVCALYDLPFLPVKDISNNEFLVQSTFEKDTGTFYLLHKELGKRAAAFLFSFLQRLATMPAELP